jgi:hypothetical protein
VLLANPAAPSVPLPRWRAAPLGVAIAGLALTQVAADNFNRANGAIAGANNWAAISTGGMSVAANEATGAAGVQQGNYRTDAYTSDQYSQCQVGSVALVAGGYIGVSVRNQDNANNYLLIYYDNAGTYQLVLYKKVAGVYTSLFTQALAGAQPQGTVLELVAEGHVLTAYLAGAPQFAILDTTFTAGGAPGIESFDANTLDNWAGGNAKTAAVSAALASDNFSVGAGVDTDGQAWALMNYPYATATVDIPITAGQLSVQNPPITAHAGDVRTDAYGADHWSAVQMGTAAMNATGFVGVTTRNQGAGATLGNSAYLGVMFQNDAYRIYRLDNGVSTELAGVPTLGNDPPGTSYTLVSQGTRHSFRVNGAEVLVATDATYAGGAPGVMMFPNSTADNWSGGNV